MTFDVSQYELEDTATMTVKTPRGDDDLIGDDGKPVTIELYSPGSPQGVKALHKAKRSNDLRTFRAFRGEFPPNDAENAAREQAEKLAAFTKSVSPNFPVAPLAIFSNPKLCYWNSQVEEYIAQKGNFSKASSPS